MAENEFLHHDHMSVPFDNDKGDGVNTPLSDQLELKVMHHRNEAYQWFTNHYYELLINQRNYVNLPTTVNRYKMEHFLRFGYNVVLGYNTIGKFTMLGYVNNNFSSSDPVNLYQTRGLDGRDVTWLVPDYLIPPHPRELTTDNENGNFIILRNKTVPLISDFETVNMYAKKYAEIEASYYSMIIQSKVATFFQSDVHDESINQVIEKLYNGSPVIKISNLLHPDRDIITVDNSHYPELLASMKDTENDIINQLNNALGIAGTGVNKQSGVSNDEVHSTDEFVNATGNIYINGIEEPLKRWNSIYDTNYHVYLNQKPASDIPDSNEEEDNNENNSEPNGYDTDGVNQ